jgi:primosomal protein N' (replication factor Y)
VNDPPKHRTPPPQPELFGDAPVAPPPQVARKSPKRKEKPRAGAETKAGRSFDEAVEVAVAAHADLLTYGVPPELLERLHVGSRVTVPLRGRLLVGVVWRRLPASETGLAPGMLRPVVACTGERIPADLLETVDFVGKYYHAPLGAAVRMALPASMRHTGVEGDDAPERQQWWVGATGVQPWPDDLSRQEVRILQRVESAGELPASDLRRQGLGDQGKQEPTEGKARAVVAPQKVLEALAERGLVRLWQARILRDPLGMRTPVPQDTPPPLTPEQRLAVTRMSQDLHANRYAGHLLRGVTGSGKTEVYLHLIAEALHLGRGAIVLVPEIALTPELVKRFRARFGDQVAALHSGMGDGERYDQYTQVQDGTRRIVVGPRSALFAPVAQLGVIVVDECHDGSFKQGAGVRYHARDVALVRARAAQAVCVLGSATPGCEEMHLVEAGRLQRTELATRALGGTLPLAKVLDLRSCERLHDAEADRPSLVSRELCDAIRATVQRGEQVMLLHNRRGYATSMICKACGEAVECPDCAITLTWHRAQGRLRCHYCDFSTPVDISCPHCKSRNLTGIGAGTERVEATLTEALPGVRIARFDRDTATGQRLLDTLERFRRRELDVLVGTQMLAKGHDFPAVTLVGVLLAESGLNIPDFRAAERTFQLLTQVAGRAGRGERPGHVLVQTYAPDHPAIEAALRHDHEGFLRSELRQRELTGWPPYAYLALLECKHEDPERAMGALALCCDRLREWGADVRGPVLAGLAKLKGIARVHALVRATDRKVLHTHLTRLQRMTRDLPPGVELTIDVDPYAFS